jgi:ABC-type sugar transport system substrate-binding protein
MAQPKVLVLLISEKQEFQRLQAEDARAAARRLGLELEIQHAEHDPATQLRQIHEVLRLPPGRRPAGIVVEPAAAVGLDAAARAAAQAGVAWAVLGDRAPAMERVREEFPGKLVLTVGTDNDGVGRIQASLFRALLPGGGGMLYVEGPSFSAAAMHRREATRQALQGSRIEVLKALSGDWTEVSAERAATVWLKLWSKSTRPVLVGAQNDEMAMGVRKAMLAVQPGWKDLPFVGVDGLPGGGQRMVREGLLAATVITPPPTGRAVELVAAGLRGEQVPPFTLMPPQPFPSIDELLRRPRT